MAYKLMEICSRAGLLVSLHQSKGWLPNELLILSVTLGDLILESSLQVYLLGRFQTCEDQFAQLPI